MKISKMVQQRKILPVRRSFTSYFSASFRYTAGIRPQDSYFLDDLTEPAKDGYATASHAPGLGYTVRQRALDKYNSRHLHATQNDIKTY